MTPLPKEFDGNRDQKGYKFRILDRIARVCLLKKWNPAHASGQEFYEVVILRSVPLKRWPNGSETPAHESMPSPEEWGTYGWSAADLATAREKFNAIVEQETNQSP